MRPHVPALALLAIVGMHMVSCSPFQHLDTIYLPTDGASEYKLFEGVAETSAIDEGTNKIYVVGENARLYVVEIKDEGKLVLETSVPLSAPATDVKVCGDYVAVATEGDKADADGTCPLPGGQGWGEGEVWPRLAGGTMGHSGGA